MTKKIYQFSGVNSLMAGVFDGLFSISDIKKHGNFGLGCTEGLAGEVIIDCCDFLEAKGHKILRTMSDTEKMPFAQITTFNPDKEIKFSHLSKDTLYQELAKHTLLDNVFLAVKLTGKFDSLKFRKPSENDKPFHTAIEVAEHQIVENLKNVEGTLIGFWTPEFFQNISVAGFHLHFINNEKTNGGHVIDYSINNGTLTYEVKYSLDLQLSDQKAYLKHDLKIDDMDKIIKKVEN